MLAHFQSLPANHLLVIHVRVSPRSFLWYEVREERVEDFRLQILLVNRSSLQLAESQLNSWGTRAHRRRVLHELRLASFLLRLCPLITA